MKKNKKTKRTKKLYSDNENLFEAIKTTQQDPTIMGLNEWKNKGYIFIPKFQREEVYSSKEKSSLVESIFMGIPIPTVFLCEEEKYKSVIDGQQRLCSFIDFYNNKYELTGLKYLSELNGKKFKDLSDTYKEKYENAPIHCVTIGKDHNELKYEIFWRLNQGKRLTEQELRNCVYHGTFNDMIEEIAKKEKLLKAMFKKQNSRKKYQEDILKFFALLDTNLCPDTSKKHLNDFMNVYKDSDDKFIRQCKSKFTSTLKLIKSVLGVNAFTTNDDEGDSSTNIYLALMTAFSHYNSHDIMKHADSLREDINNVKRSKKFRVTLEKSTNSKKNIQTRYTLISKAILKYIDNRSNDDRRTFSKAEKKLLWHDDYVCSFCGNKILSIDDAEVDHTLAYTKGGKTNLENAQLLHSLCNKIKSNK